ncbi:MAG: antirestriction protein ArdA [Hydrogenoanaerobacterium sp.]
MNIRIKSENGMVGLELPCREEKIAEFCKKLDISNNSKTEVTVDYVYLNDRANALLSGRTYNLDKLNYLTKRLDSFDKNELTTFYAVAYSEKSNDIDNLINLTFNTHCYRVVSDFSNLDTIGKSMYLVEQGGVTMGQLDRLDGESYFKKVLADNPNPLVTPYGIIYKNKNASEQVYDGIHLPQYEWEENMGTVTLNKDGFAEYLYLPYVETELTKALEQLGATDVSECEVTLDSSLFNDEMKNIIKALPKNSQEELNSINHITERIAEMGTKEMPYLGNLTGDLQPQTMKDLDAIFDSAYEFEMFDGIYNAKDYGRYMIIDSGHFEYDENLEEYIDFEKYGSQRLQHENGAFTDQGYILYHGYNQDLSQMLAEIGIEIPEQQTQILKLYMPLHATTYQEENMYGYMEQTDEEIELAPYDIAKFEDEILEAIEKNALPEESKRGLMKYYGDNDSVNAKVKRYNFSVEVVGDELMGVATVELNTQLDEREMGILKDTISGQASDGWGEGFEQREIKCGDRDVYVSFWQSKNWSLQTAEELGISEPKQELTMGGM